MASSEPSDDPPRKRYNIGAAKIPRSRRDVARGVMRTAADARKRGYRDVLGSDTPDDDEKFPLGSNVTYSLELTEAEAAEFAAASNVRYIEEDAPVYPLRALGRPTGLPEIPTAATLGYMRATTVDLRRWHGRDVLVAVLDEGTTAAVRATMGFTLVARTATGGLNLGGREIYNENHDHGCLVASNAVPAGGLLLDCNIVAEANEASSNAAIAAGITWAVDNGARVINISYGGGTGVPPQVYQDAAAYARDNGNVQIVLAAGNANLNDLEIPSGLSRLFANCYSSIAFDESTDRRARFSSHHADGSGCAPGNGVTSLDIYGYPRTWDGTSASAPHMTQLIARGATGGTFTTAQIAVALRNNARDTGAGASEQGAGAWDLQRALAALGAIPATPATAGVSTVSHLSSLGTAGLFTDITMNSPSGIQSDDMRIMFIVASAGAALVVPRGWRLLTELTYFADRELAAGLTVGPTVVRVLTKPYTTDEPPATVFRSGSNWRTAGAAMTLRGLGGMDPDRFAPMVRFGTSASITSQSVLPTTTNDLLVTMFAQRCAEAHTASMSVPSGLTNRGFWRPAADPSVVNATGYQLMLATTQLSSGARTASYTATSTDSAGTWCSVALTVPTGAAAIAPVVQTEPAGPPGAFLPFYVGS